MAVGGVENRLLGAFLMVMEKVVLPGVEMAVRPITWLSEARPNNMNKNLHQRDFSGSTHDIPLMTASGQIYSNINHRTNDDTRNNEITESKNFRH